MLRLPSPSVTCLWLLYGTALIHIEGAFQECTSSVRRFFILLSPFEFECQSLPLILSSSVCISLKKYFFIALFNICFSHSLPPAHFGAPPPPLPFSHHFFLCHFFFCSVDENNSCESCVYLSQPPCLNSNSSPFQSFSPLQMCILVHFCASVCLLA